MKVLIIVDMQNDFVTGSLANEAAQAIVPKVRAKLDEYLERDDMVFFTRDTHFTGYLDTQEGKLLPVEHCIKDTEGWKVIPELEIYGENIHYINKAQFGYEGWKKQAHLFGISAKASTEVQLGKELMFEFVGTCTDICVVSNALILKAMYPEAKVMVDASCCAGLTPEKHQAALEVMKSCQIEVINE